MNYNELSDELKAKVAECKTVEDVLKLAQEEGYELSEEELEAISGGEGSHDWTWSCWGYCHNWSGGRPLP